MGRLIRALTKGLLVLTITAMILAMPTIYRGYHLYRTAVEDMSVEDKVEMIRNDADYVSLEEISEYFRNKIIGSEDKRFRFHYGIDPLAIIRAVKNDLIAGEFVEGGSTITQQLAKNMYFDFDKNLERKVAEVFVAFRLEQAYTKDEILELYLNCIYFGEDCYGIKEAARYYYNTVPAALTQIEANSLVYTIKCPNLYNPVTSAAV